jgi:hypothetical protein
LELDSSGDLEASAPEREAFATGTTGIVRVVSADKEAFAIEGDPSAGRIVGVI